MYQTIHLIYILLFLCLLCFLLLGDSLLRRNKDHHLFSFKHWGLIQFAILFQIFYESGQQLFALLLEHFNARVPYLDSATTVLSAAAMILTVMRRFEQWLCWTLVNSISIVMWYKVYLTSGNSVATLLMWVVFFICGLVFAWQWYKSAEQAR